MAACGIGNPFSLEAERFQEQSPANLVEENGGRHGSDELPGTTGATCGQE